jgi:2-polyprenyl-3-methyl-5-hydroxy-6-metoxy-1,4-benzoquinol methylase
MNNQICRMCQSSRLHLFLDLGYSALSDGFLTKNDLNKAETSYPLNVLTCKNCGLCQLGYVVPPQYMFNKNYPYDSSTTKSGREHFFKMGKDICNFFNLQVNSLVMDVGSNTGVLLSSFKSKNMRVLGIEPSDNVANVARKKKIDTITDFFSHKLAKKVVKKYGKVSVLTATNVFAHINNLDDFMNGVKTLLKHDGILIIEAPYLVNLIDNLEYDTIYHEHLSYISVKPMKQFCIKHKMELFNVEMKKIHGGTMRYFIARQGKRKITKNVNNYLKIENHKKIYSNKQLEIFAKKVYSHRSDLIKLIFNIKKSGKKIVGISAPAKGNTLLNYCKIGPDLLDYITEKNPMKIGKYTPGTHIPVHSDKKLLSDKPDYALLLAWNFSEEIMKNNESYKKNKGKFIIPLPYPKII